MYAPFLDGFLEQLSRCIHEHYPEKSETFWSLTCFRSFHSTVDFLLAFSRNIPKLGHCVRVSSWGLSTSLPSRQGVGLSREGNGSLFHDSCQASTCCTTRVYWPRRTALVFMMQASFHVQLPFVNILFLNSSFFDLFSYTFCFSRATVVIISAHQHWRVNFCSF